MIGNLFGKGRFLDKDLQDWSLETFAWLMRNLGGLEILKARKIVVPTPDFFPRTETEGHDRAQFLLDCLKSHMGLEGVETRLEPFERRDANAQVSQFVFLNNGGSANGLFHLHEGVAWIGYAADLIDQPHNLVATLAHELCHYNLHLIEEPVPGGEIAHELATELCVAYCGLGVFAANTAFEFSQHGDSFSQGWRSSRNGYFSERAWAFALGTFLALTGEPTPTKWLKPGIAKMTVKARRYLETSPSLTAPLRSIA